MPKKIRTINNPLTIVAVFAGLSEVTSIFALKYVDPSLQHIFIWFVMGFPTILVLLFFAILFFKNRVLYAPRDFKDETNFLKTLDYVSNNLEVIEVQFESAKKELLEKLKTDSDMADEVKKQLADLVNQQFADIKNNLAYTKDAVELIPLSNERRLSKLESDILDFLTEQNKEFSMAEIIEELNLSPIGSGMAVRGLLDKQWIIYKRTNKGIVYTINPFKIKS